MKVLRDTTVFTEGVSQSVADMAAIRDFRQMQQKRLCHRYGITAAAKNNVLVMFSLVIPGAIKTNCTLDAVFEQGIAAFDTKIRYTSAQCYAFSRYRHTAGHTAFWCIATDAFSVKCLCTKLERNCLLGQLWDFDVFSAFEHKITATDAGLSERTCLLCSSPAKVCARNRTHSIQALQQKISAIICAAER